MLLQGPSLTVGGRAFGPSEMTVSTGSTAGLLILTVGHVSLSNYSPLVISGASTAYQVPAGKILTIWACKAWATNGSAANATTIGLLYGTAASAFDTATAPTGAVYLGGPVAGKFQLPAGQVTVQNGDESSFVFTCPALSYPTSRNSQGIANMSGIFYGILA